MIPTIFGGVLISLEMFTWGTFATEPQGNSMMARVILIYAEATGPLAPLW